MNTLLRIRPGRITRVRREFLRRLLRWAGHHFAKTITVAALSLRILLIVAGLHGFGLTLLMEKPPGPYFFLCAVVAIGSVGSVLSNDKRPNVLKIAAAVIIGTAAQQIVHWYLASNSSRLWLTLQFLALEILVIGALLRPRKGNGE